MGAAPSRLAGAWPRGGGCVLFPIPSPQPRMWGAASSPRTIYFSRRWEYFLRVLFACRWCNRAKGSCAGRNPGPRHAPSVAGTSRLQHRPSAHPCATRHATKRVAQIPPARCEGHGVKGPGCALARCRVLAHAVGACRIARILCPPPVPASPISLSSLNVPHVGRELPVDRGCCHPCGDMQQHPRTHTPGVPAPCPAAHTMQPLRKSLDWGTLQHSDAAALPWQRVTSCLGAQGTWQPRGPTGVCLPWGGMGAGMGVGIRGGCPGGCGCPSAPSITG